MVYVVTPKRLTYYPFAPLRNALKVVAQTRGLRYQLQGPRDLNPVPKVPRWSTYMNPALYNPPFLQLVDLLLFLTI